MNADFTYYGTNAGLGCVHEWVEIKKGSLIKRGKVVKIKTYECPKCEEIRVNVTTVYPPF
jgi:hypothetical protein